jgi:hypothetical protein
MTIIKNILSIVNSDFKTAILNDLSLIEYQGKAAGGASAFFKING